MNEEAQRVYESVKKSIQVIQKTKKWLKWCWVSVTFILSNFVIFLGLIVILVIGITIEQQHQVIEVEKMAQEDNSSSEDIPIVDGDIIFPLDNFRVTCGFTCYSNHGGLDMSGGYGADVRAVMSGVVTKVVIGYSSNGGYLGHPGGYGNQILITHENGIQTRYAHLVDSIRVAVGDEVVIGQVIGQQGNSGNSSGSHLHFEWIENGSRVDPMTRLPFDNIEVSSRENKPTIPST